MHCRFKVVKSVGFDEIENTDSLIFEKNGDLAPGEIGFVIEQSEIFCLKAWRLAGARPDVGAAYVTDHKFVFIAAGIGGL